MKTQSYYKLIGLISGLALLLALPHLGRAALPAPEAPDVPEVARIEQPDQGAAGRPKKAQFSQSMSTPQLIEVALARRELDQETANLYLAYAFGDYDKLPARYRSNVPWHGTLPLRRLKEALNTMRTGAKRTAIEKLLTGSCGSHGGPFSNVQNSTNFHIEYNTIGGGLTINDYVTSLETAWTTEITTFGWAAPPVLGGNPPPGNLYHVLIDTLSGGLYGFVTNSGTHAGPVGDNPNTTWDDGDAQATCMVLNQDYTGFPGSSQQALDATTAHEFNHSIQFGYGALSGANVADDNFVEGGATWMEDEVFDTANDNYNYLWPTFSICMGEYTVSPYPYWITFRGLTEPYGTGTAGGGEQIMQDFWEATSKNTGDNLGALSAALSTAGTTLADAYHAYAVAVKFNKSCGGGYVSPYCFDEGASYVTAAGTTLVSSSIITVGNSTAGSIADNYALNWINLPTGGGPYDVTLQNTSGGGQLRGSVVCDTGTTLNVSPLPAVVGSGSASSLLNFNPSGCNSVVAVLTNQAQTANNPTSCSGRSYTLGTQASSGGNSAPNIPHTPNPVDGASDVSTNQMLGWQGGDPNNDPLTYTLAFGTNPTPPVVATDLTGTSYNPTLVTSTTYYWAITATDGLSTTIGPTWNFTTSSSISPTGSIVFLPIVMKPAPPPSTLLVAEDTTILQGYASSNLCNTGDMWAGYDDNLNPDGRIARSLIKFDLSGIPAGTSISQATLNVRHYGSWDFPGRSRTITTYRVGSSWSACSATWNNQPAIAEAYGSQSIPFTTGSWYAFDVTNLVRGWVNGSFSNDGLWLRGPEAAGADSAWRSFFTADTTSDPYLSITYSRLAKTKQSAPSGAEDSAPAVPLSVLDKPGFSTDRPGSIDSCPGNADDAQKCLSAVR